jgi:hypothetical protein
MQVAETRGPHLAQHDQNFESTSGPILPLRLVKRRSVLHAIPKWWRLRASWQRSHSGVDGSSVQTTDLSARTDARRSGHGSALDGTRAWS